MKPSDILTWTFLTVALLLTLTAAVFAFHGDINAKFFILGSTVTAFSSALIVELWNRSPKP